LIRLNPIPVGARIVKALHPVVNFVVELAMDRRVTHPTKEQVRAYMLAREHAFRPPPAPEEIRRQLNWHVVGSDNDCVLSQLFLLPATFGQIAMQAALDWCLLPLRAQLATQASGCVLDKGAVLRTGHSWPFRLS
jgi:hypothetical protein